MKQKELENQGDELALLREAWQAHTQRVSELPKLDDETLEQLFADFCENHDEVPPLTARRSQRWQQVLTAVVCLAAAVCCAVGCVRMWDDVPFRLLLGVAAVGVLLCVWWSVNPHNWFLYNLHWHESLETACADGRPTTVGYAIRSVLPLGATAFAILCVATQMPIGDGYHITATHLDRLVAVANVTNIIALMV